MSGNHDGDQPIDFRARRLAAIERLRSLNKRYDVKNMPSPERAIGRKRNPRQGPPLRSSQALDAMPGIPNIPMRTLGLLGGMSWESTLTYYRLINERVRERLGGLHSAKLVLYSLDFAEIEHLQKIGDWKTAGRVLATAALSLEYAGAEALVLCTNTMHRVLDVVGPAIHIPTLHIADATAQRIRQSGMSKVGLLATRFTMEQDFYRGRLERNGLEVLVPEAEERAEIHRIIYDELCLGTIRDDSREIYRTIMAGLVARGAQGLILGCTEIGLLVGANDTTVPLFDTARIHAEDAVDWALRNARST